MSLEILDDKQKLQQLKNVLHQHSAPAAEELIQRKDNGDVQCFACGHRCVVKPGRDGVCRVRFNDNGTLLVPFGYVATVACDPIEKKPFFHVLAGSDALTFGMLGCDYHCGYCFPPETLVTTGRGQMTLAEAFAAGATTVETEDATVAFPSGLQAVAASGSFRTIKGIFKHPYRGKLSIIKPFYFPEIRCTPDHRVHATTDPSTPPQPIRAELLTLGHYLAMPRRIHVEATEPLAQIDVHSLLLDHTATHKVRWKLPEEHRQLVMSATAAGASSAQIGRQLGKSASYIRHVRARLARAVDPESRSGGPIIDEGMVRFAHERRRGIPASIALDGPFATLLGYYCAEGCAVRSKERPNSYILNFSFCHEEDQVRLQVGRLLNQRLGLSARSVKRETTHALAIGKTSAALLFKSLCGGRATEKRVPRELFQSPPPVVRSFLDAYVQGDGHHYPNGKIGITTVSRKLAHGVAQLALQLGHFPSIYDQPMSAEGIIEGRAIRRSPHQYTVVWYEGQEPARKVIHTPNYHLIPLRELSSVDYDGDVYNMEVEEEHNYLAGFLLVSNCQNWVTSQMLRDAKAVAQAKLCRPADLVNVALQHRAPVVASSYNEPLITSEWAVAVFKEAKARGLRCAYISNGNGTPQVLDYIRPYVDAYKVDLKTFDPKHYRQLGGVMENVTDTIKNLKQRGFWVEIVTLVVPGFSDNPDDLKRMAEFLASVDPLMPWHMTAFHPDYKMTEGYRRTVVDDLMKVVEMGKQAGLRYLYPGNLPGQVGEWENTRCHHCNATVIRRHGFLVMENRMGQDGLCPECHKTIPGIWGRASGHGDGRVRPIA